MNEEMTKSILLDQIHQERELLQTTLSKLGQTRLLEEVEGGWTVKDIISHITAWEGKMIDALQTTLDGGEPHFLPPGKTWEEVGEQINHDIHLANREKPLDQVLTESQESYKRSLEIIQEFPEQDLLSPDRFEWREGRPLWMLVAGNTNWHYKEHRQMLEEWMNI